MADDQPVRHVRVDASRFVVGRKPDASLCIPSPTVSREHAELTVVDSGLLLRDLGSTNGTYVNGTRINQPCTVHHGDLLQFGQVVFRVVQQSTESGPQTIQDDSCDRALALIQFDQLMTQRAVTPHFQPIVAMSDRRGVGLRGAGPQPVLRAEGPAFDVRRGEGAESGRRAEPHLARGRNSQRADPAARIMRCSSTRIRPRSTTWTCLIFSLGELRELEPRRPLVLEIHEAAVTCGEQMKRCERR